MINLISLLSFLFLSFQAVASSPRKSLSSKKSTRSKSKTLSSSRIKTLSNSTVRSESSRSLSLLDRARQVNEDIKEFARLQLNLPPLSVVDFTNYKIENWPEFVSRSPRCWDGPIISELQTVLPTFKFVPISKKIISEFDSEHGKKLCRRKVLDLLLAEFNSQTGESSSRISWQKYHVHCWPLNVNSRPDRWNWSEIRSIYRNLKSIKFYPVEGNEARTITYSNGECNIVGPNSDPEAELVSEPVKAELQNTSAIDIKVETEEENDPLQSILDSLDIDDQLLFEFPTQNFEIDSSTTSGFDFPCDGISFENDLESFDFQFDPDSDFIV
jgi:hypothetical protein